MIGINSDPNVPTPLHVFSVGLPVSPFQNFAFGLPTGIEGVKLPVTFSSQRPNPDTIGSLSGNELTSYNQSDFLDLGIDLDQTLVTAANLAIGGVPVFPPLEGNLPLIPSVLGVDYTLVGAGATFGFGIGQQFNFSGTPLAQLHFSKPVQYYGTEIIGTEPIFGPEFIPVLCFPFGGGCFNQATGQPYILPPDITPPFLGGIVNVPTGNTIVVGQNPIYGQVLQDPTDSLIYALGSQIDLVFPEGEEDLMITPEYFLDASLTNITSIPMGPQFDLRVLSLGPGVLFPGIPVVGNIPFGQRLGPIYSLHTGINVANPAIFNRTFDVDFSSYRGAAFTLAALDNGNGGGASPIPEPGTLSLLGLGLLGAFNYRRKNKS